MDLDAVVRRYGDRLSALEQKATAVLAPAAAPAGQPAANMETRFRALTNALEARLQPLAALAARVQALEAELVALRKPAGASNPTPPATPPGAPALGS